MKRNARLSAAAGALCSCLLVASQAGAVDLFLQAGAGFKFLGSGFVQWTNTFAADTTIQIQDGRRIAVLAPLTFNGTAGNRTWVVPIPVDVTNVNWSSTAYDQSSSGDFSQRICSFTQPGAFSSCGASVAKSSASTTLVPSGGTAFSQSFLISRFDSTGLPQGDTYLSTIKATR
jgi:hypothetical protein